MQDTSIKEAGEKLVNAFKRYFDYRDSQRDEMSSKIDILEKRLADLEKEFSILKKQV